VLDEQEALEAAVEYYKKAFEDGRSISAGNQQIQASYLIAELSRRIGKYEDGKQYFNTTIKYGQEFIYQNRRDQSRTALARKILELAIEQGRENMDALKSH
jgi:tetratricopeptide (TPR) repeat protein